jgi:parallel beta-helix repeat protein
MIWFSGCITDNDAFFVDEYIVNLNDPDAFHLIQNAIDACPVNGTVFIGKGRYVERIIINKSLTIQGSTQGTIIDGNFSGSVIELDSDNIKLSQLIVQHGQLSSSSTSDVAGIKIRGNDNMITACLLKNNTAGIRIVAKKNNIITDNIFENNTYGLYASSTAYSDFSNNIFKYNTKYGIYLYSLCKYNNVSFNRFQNNTCGCRVKGDHNRVFQNLFRENQGGLYFCCGATGNMVYQNNFINNSLYQGNGNFRGNTWYHSINQIGNFWDDYTGDDENNDGIGEHAYIIEDRNQSGIIETIIDEFPLMNPFSFS